MRRIPGLAALVAAVLLAGCGTTNVKTVTEHVPAAQSGSSERPGDRGAAATRRASSNAKSVKARARKAASPGRWTACDDNIDAWRPKTSCVFAQNAFYEYWVSGQTSPVMVHSPALGRSLSTRCRSGASRVICSTSDGGRVRFQVVALEMYSDEQAATYAASHDTGTDSTSALAGDDVDGSSASETYDEGGSSYDDSAGEEIPNYDNGTGYRVQCADGMYSQSGGRPGACSGHGGVDD